MTTWIVMHGTEEVAQVKTNGQCEIYAAQFMPYNLYFEETDKADIDILINNINNFYYWCASRVLTLDRTYAKEILNSIGAVQGTTDKVRAQIALSYHALSLMDIYWVKEKEEKASFSDINLFQNHMRKSFVDVTLRGKQMTIQNQCHLVKPIANP